ncbi:sirohydrochlorin chelatase [Streptomyces nitrosporeus]|uniref:sirohydrochlorin chelatase n=1 Tax=Streptomyces nitrosporeus TaxID=28894 RepID=UPI0039A33C60
MTETAPEPPREPLPSGPGRSTAYPTARAADRPGPAPRDGNRRPAHRVRATARPAAPTLVAVAHGSRDPRALGTALDLLDRVRELRPRLDVRLGHIELNQPLLPATLTAVGRGEAVLVPLLLGRGHHVRHDLPRAAGAASALRTSVAAPLGPHPLLVETLYERLTEAGWQDTDGTRRDTAVVLAAAGSRDPDSAADARRTAAMLSDRLGGTPVVPAYTSATAPDVPTALRALAARGRHRAAVAAYFTAPGRFATTAAAAAPWIAAAPLGAHPAMARLVLHRYDRALSGAASARAARPHGELLRAAP